MILGASHEFDRRHNADIIERISDNEEVPAVRRIALIILILFFFFSKFY